MPRTADFKEKGSSVSTARATRLVLTNRHLRGLKPTAHAQDFYDVQQRGLIARILPGAIVQFSVRYGFQGEQKRLKLGAYPAVSLQAAQTRTQYAGRDRRRARPGWRTTCGESRANGRVEALAADYLQKHARQHKRSADEDERILDADVLAHWREISVRDLTRRDVRVLIDRVAERAPIMANRVLARVRKMLNLAVDHDWIDANPRRVCKSPHAKCRAIAYSPKRSSAVCGACSPICH